jgi:hypothetical protein
MEIETQMEKAKGRERYISAIDSLDSPPPGGRVAAPTARIHTALSGRASQVVAGIASKVRRPKDGLRTGATRPSNGQWAVFGAQDFAIKD